MKPLCKNQLVGILFVMLATLLLPLPAAARILLLDAHFDNRTIGNQLDRRGALYGEPVSGPYDSQSETIFEDNPGDHSVRLEDTQVNDPDNLYWALREGRAIEDGKLFLSCELELEWPEDFHLTIRSEDLISGNFFQLIFDDAGDVSWRDGDDPNLTSLGFYPVGLPIYLSWEFDMDSGIYNFTMNGTQYVSGGTHSVVGQGIGSIVVGHRDDGDATGAFRFDMPSVSWRPGSASLILDADFSGHPAGVPIGTGGAEFGEPFYLSGTAPVVEFGLPLGNKALMIPDESTVGTATCGFEFLGSVEPTTPLSISFWMSFDDFGDFLIYFREQGGATQNFLDIRTNSAGQVFFSDEGVVNTVHSYSPNTPIRVELSFEPDFDYYSVWWDGDRIVYRESHGITTHEVGSIYFGNDFDADLDGVIRVDRIKVHTLATPTPVQETASLPAVPTLQAAPNPFNPATEVAFELPRSGRVQLDIYDSRGRHVHRLLAADLPSGMHRTTWRGVDATGQQVASGVYHAVLTSDGTRQSLPVTLVK